MPALTCSSCGIDWPLDYKHYHPICASCDEHRTFWNVRGKPLDPKDAWKLKCWADFDRWLIANGRMSETERLESIPVLDEPVNSD